MRKPSFSVVSTAIAILVGLGFVSKALVGFIPAPDESELAREPSIFLRRAAIQQIEWKKPTDEAFASARRRDLPILLFMGNGFDPLARGLDRGVLLSPRVQAFLSRNFECVRVDLVAHPEFRNAFLPLTKAKLGVSPGFQMIVVDSSGKIIDHVATLVGLFPNDEALFIRELVEARNRFEQPILARGEVSFEEAQREDLKALEGLEVPSPPAFANFTRDLVADIDPAGGFNDPDHRTLRAEPWRFLLAIGRISDFEDSIMPVLHSPVADLLDGGFFSGSRDVKWIEVEHGKSAVVNSEMASLLSAAALVSNDPEYRYLAERTFDGFLNEFVQPTGILTW